MVKKIFAQTYLWILLLLLYSPIVIIVIYSFTEAKVLGNWTGFSTKLYSSLFTTGAHHSLMNALINTITIALLAATASTLLGSIAAIGIFNPNIYEAALDLGATPMQALWKVIIPEIRPGMISGFMLALTLSIDDFAVTVFTIGNQGLETLSTYIYADARKGGLTPELRPLSAIIFVVVLALLVVINYRAGKTKKKD